MNPLVVVDPELSSLIPPLDDGELAQLEENILAEGCRDALVVWDEGKILLDGHNRLRICEKHGLPYRTAEVSLPSREAAADWIDANQLGRRNLTPEQMSLLRGRRYNRLKRQDGGHGDQKSVGQNVRPKAAESLAQQHGVDERTIRRDGQFAQAVEELRPHVADIQERVMSGDIPSRQAVIEAAREPERAPELLKPHVAHNSGENEWYTPQKYIDAARQVMGTIDTAPASTALGNETVKAHQFFTAEDDGLSKQWVGNVWLNPPYAQPLIRQFAEVVTAKYLSGEIQQACILVNNATETAWFQTMLKAAKAACFIEGRVRFLDIEGMPGAPLQGQIVLYMGDKAHLFKDVFSRMGVVLGPV